MTKVMAVREGKFDRGEVLPLGRSGALTLAPVPLDGSP